MAWCESQFQTLADNLKLNPTRRSRIDSAVSRFEDFCKGDEELSVAMDGTPFLQGSVAAKTSVRPIDSDEHDVDVVFPFKLSVFKGIPTPTDIINWFLGRLRTSDFYKERLIPKNRCARIDYAGDFHLDLIPATRGLPTHQPYAVPARDVQQWVATDPVGFTQWVDGVDARGGDKDADGCGRFVRSTLIMKRWRDRKFGAASAPSSILLTTLLGKHDPSQTYIDHVQPRLYPDEPFMAAYIYDMLRLTDCCIDVASTSAFEHPTLPEDLARGWQHEHLALFQTRLKACIGHIASGITADSEENAMKSYREAFGEFPAS